MASYSYVNGVYPVTVEIRYGWKRLNKCNAQVQHLVSQNGNREHWNFISYNTPICRVTRIDDSWRVDLSHDWNCSVSTQRQLQKFFDMFDLPCNGYWCKQLERIYQTHAIDYMYYDTNDIKEVFITFIDNNRLDNYMKSNACRNNSYPMIIANN